jgi:peptide-methionine (S)-S-oxide reductase
VEKAIFAAGCFWGVEAAFRGVGGVLETRVGYTGGHAPNPSYAQVCSDRTGHAEAVEVGFDPARVSYEELLAVFWDIHDPSQSNRQGADVGSQYRSAVFYLTPEQERAARASKAALQADGRYGRNIVTELKPAGPFYEAEEYHQQYLQRRGLARRLVR